MKRILGIVVFVMIFCASFVPLQAQDGIFSNPQSLDAKEFSLGIQPAIYTQAGKDEFMLMARTAYGFNSNFSLHGKLGVFRDETYFGAHIEYMLAREPVEPISFTAVGGIHKFGRTGVKLGGVLSKQISEFSLYTGLTFEPLFTDEVLTPLLLPVGIDIPVNDGKTSFIFEADLGLNGDAEQFEAVHFGVDFYL